MKTEDAITVLRELAKNANKRSKIGQIRELMPYIEEAMKSGITLADIHAALTEKCGIDIKLMTFIGSYKRIKKERKEKPNKTTAAESSSITPKTNESATTQQKNENQLTEKKECETEKTNPFEKRINQTGDIRRNQFEYNPTPDLNKIYGDNDE